MRVNQKISQLASFSAQPKVGDLQAPDTLILAAQDTGLFNLFKVKAEPELLSDGFFNQLSMIYKVEMLPNDANDADYCFALGTNNGIAFLKISKADYRMRIDKEAYLTGRIINNFLLRGNRIIAFEYEREKFKVIDRKTKETLDIPWIYEDPLCVTGLCWVPNFHPNELSIVLIRDPNGVHMVNT